MAALLAPPRNFILHPVFCSSETAEDLAMIVRRDDLVASLAALA
jgi:hypothetical protein